MSERVRILFYALWIVQPILLAAIAVAILRSGRQRQFKYFFIYILSQILIFSVAFPTYRHRLVGWCYFNSLGTAVSVALGFKMIHEAFLDISQSFHSLRDLGAMLFKWAGLVLLLVAGVVALTANSPSDVAPWMQAIYTAQRCVRIIQVGMVLFLLFLARYFGISWRRYSFGIALGLGIYAMVELSLVSLWLGDYMNGRSVDLVNMTAYNCSLLIWLGYTLAKNPAREAPAILLPPQRKLGPSSLQHPIVTGPLIPMFEGMVDRAMSRPRVSPPVIPPDAAKRELKTACDMFVAAYKSITRKYPDIKADKTAPDESITDYIRKEIQD